MRTRRDSGGRFGWLLARLLFLGGILGPLFGKRFFVGLDLFGLRLLVYRTSGAGTAL